MENKENITIVNEYVNAFNSGDLDQLRSLFSEDAEIQGVFGRGLMDKITPIWKQLILGLGMQLKIEDIISEGNKVAVRYTETGTFKGEFQGNKPTGKSYELIAMEWFIIEDGKIKKRWGARDFASQAKQIGLEINNSK